MLTDWVTEIMNTLGGPGAGLLVALENIFPPIPSELILPLAGFTASQGRLSLASALVWTTIGSLVGALVLYGLGRALGEDRLRRAARRIPLLREDDLDRTDAWFGRHGTKAVFFGRMVPVFRSLISIPAGVDRMRIGTFALLTFAGSLVWNTALILGGYGLGTQWTRVQGYAGYFQTAVLVAIGGWLVWFVVRRVRQARAARAARAARSGAGSPPASPRGS